MNNFDKRWSIHAECCHCCSTQYYVYTVQRSAGCCRPLSSHWSPQWASNSGSLNWQQLWRGSGEAGRLGGTGDGDTMAMDGGPVVLVTPLHHTRAGAYLRGDATIWLSVTMRQLATKYIIWYPTISLSVYLHICSCLLCLKCTEFVILCLYNSTNRVYIIHQIKSK